MDERRGNPRTRALKAGRIILPGGFSTFDCMIRNLSPVGAKIVMESTLSIPDSFTLRFEDGSDHECHVRWRKPGELGIRFVSPDPISG